MGKFLRRFLHGLLPSSWVVKIKLSDGPPRKLLPFLRGASTPSSKSVSTLQNCASSNSASTIAALSINNNTNNDSDDEILTEIKDETARKDQNRKARVIQKAVDKSSTDKNSATKSQFGKRKRKSESWEQKNSSSSHSQIHSYKWRSKRAKKTATTTSKAGAIAAELPDCLCEVVGDTSAVVKYVEDPDQELWESMVEMIVGNELWDLPTLECLLYCYLSLNDSPLHHTIERTFMRVISHLQTTS